MAVTTEFLEQLGVRQTANNFIRELKLLDASTVRKAGEPSRIERLRAVVARKMGVELPGSDDSDDKLTREHTRSKSASGSKLAFVFQRGNNGGPLRVESDEPELEALRGCILYIIDAGGGALPVATVE